MLGSWSIPQTIVFLFLGTRLPTSSASCDGGVMIGGQCFTFSTEKLSWIDAKQKCLSQNARLAVPKDPQALFRHASANYYETGFWLGASDIENEGSWFWEDGRPLNTSDKSVWRHGEPNNAFENEDCLNLASDAPCSRPERYVCEKVPRVCVGNAVAFGSQCLTFNNENDLMKNDPDWLNWDNSVNSCAAKGGRLAKLEHPLEVYDYLYAKYQKSLNKVQQLFWVGASDIANEGSWVWLDGTPLDDQFPWNQKLIPQPSGGKDRNCLVVIIDNTGDHEYLSWGCESNFHYICEDEVCPRGCVHGQGQCTKPNECTCSPGYSGDTCNIAISALTWDVVGDVDNFVRFNIGDHGIKKTWEQARRICKSHQLELYTPVDIIRVKKYLSDNYADFYHIGARNSGDELVWLTGGQPLTSDLPWTSDYADYLVGTFREKSDSCVGLYALTNKALSIDPDLDGLAIFRCNVNTGSFLCG